MVDLGGIPGGSWSTNSGVSRILYRGVLDSLRAKRAPKKIFPATPTLISHAPQLKNVRMLTTQCYYNTLVGVVYSLVCNIKKVNDTLRPICSFSLFLDMLVS